MHYIKRVKKEVDKTHPRLGNLVAFLLVATWARKCVIVVAPSGTGKSTACNALKNFYTDEFFRKEHGVTKAGLKRLEDILNGFEGVFIVDDLSADTTYMKIFTCSAMAQLAYEHFVSKYSGTVAFRIENFYGGIVINTQPTVFKYIVSSDVWEPILRDKSIRYYHFYRPIKARAEIPKFTRQENPIPIDDVTIDTRSKYFRKFEKWFRFQHSRARAKEHLSDILRAIAGLDGRTKVKYYDYKILKDLYRPCLAEYWLLYKIEFETMRQFYNNLACILTELCTYRNKLRPFHVALDYGVSIDTVYRLCRNLSEFVIFKFGSKKRYIVPTKKCLEILRFIDPYYDWKRYKYSI